MKNVFPIIVTHGGVTSRIQKATQNHNGQSYGGYLVSYSLLGKRKRIWRSGLSDAKSVAKEACNKVSKGEQLSLTLTNSDRMVYLRAIELLASLKIPIDVAAQEYAGAVTLLGGRATLTEACRDWIKHNATELPRIHVSAAVEKLKAQALTDRKSSARRKQLAGVLDRFARSFNVEAHTLTPKLISSYLSALPLSERSRRNHRDVLGFFSRWLVLHGYLPKGADLLEGVQNYSARKIGQILIWTPEEGKLLLHKAHKQMKRLVPFLAIAAFAELRHSEIGRLDWQQVELSEKSGESFIEVLPIENTKSDQRRRLVPVKDNLRAWLSLYRKPAGNVCPFKNVTKQLLKLASGVGLKWKKNGFRHTCISCRVAETNNVPLVADESGNSVAVIRTNYLRRLKPAIAADWFSIMPPRRSKGRKLILQKARTERQKG